MSTSAVWIMDLKGRIIISRDYRGDISMNVSQQFTKHLNLEDEENMTPIFQAGLSFLSSFSLYLCVSLSVSMYASGCHPVPVSVSNYFFFCSVFSLLPCMMCCFQVLIHLFTFVIIIFISSV